jgi:NTP pyrophosphatase (non-canonical NTP hydrolase)
MELRPEVQKFAEAMEEQLRANDHKPGWKKDHPRMLGPRLEEEMRELQAEVERAARNPKQILKEAADVANFAMMVADVCGGLGG